jgi:hypothetical protein
MSSVHVAVREVVDVLLQASVAINVLVWERLHPVLDTAPFVNVIVGLPQASVAVAVPKARSIAVAEGLHPSAKAFPELLIKGGVLSLVHVTVLDAVEVLPHASLAVHVLVCERPHPLFWTAPSLCVNVVAPHTSDAVAVPKALVISPAVGLQPNVELVPPVVIIGGELSSVQFAFRDAVDVLPHASVANHVRVCDREHPVL